ncbi:type 2 isopentenyl-diphosphate Delta-isomerase [Streptococcus sp. DD12]|uniref:type 2 isopentenyl-diphosphate Delta-isomerase n=1 Tax=Streptococcus sp. DD12 TaxID=1777880 RepID=UPI000794A020|nr:type 2 isopentenyl-diphosphate Delta-isomerase [Streptococcus sp. DD12]KXT75779.1 Isopentenyl-diphosphate delta-isomerase, FMN-dependent [Streptococcus sp. DD12]
MNRKDQHIAYALRYQSPYNAFDDMELLQSSLPEISPHQVDLSTTVLGEKWAFPFYINAMTGGSAKAEKVNHKLAQVALACDLVMVTGSYSAALAGQEPASFHLRESYPDLRLATNIGLDKTPEQAQTVVAAMQPLFLQVHVNLMQELLMPEGEREFSNWLQHLNRYPKEVTSPLMLKEVGFGMDPETLARAQAAGFKAVDISGRGGTSFAFIENQRSSHGRDYLNDWGQTTPLALLRSQPYQEQLEVLASGGIRQPLDMVKAFVLGAKAVGLSRTILEMVERQPLEEVIAQVKAWKEDLRLLMTALNAASIDQLKDRPYLLYGRLKEAWEQVSGEIACKK